MRVVEIVYEPQGQDHFDAAASELLRIFGARRDIKVELPRAVDHLEAAYQAAVGVPVCRALCGLGAQLPELERVEAVLKEAQELYDRVGRHIVRGADNTFWGDLLTRIDYVKYAADIMVRRVKQAEQEAKAHRTEGARVAELGHATESLCRSNNRVSDLANWVLGGKKPEPQGLKHLSDAVKANYQDAVTHCNRLNAAMRWYSGPTKARLEEMLRVAESIRRNCLTIERDLKKAKEFDVKAAIKGLEGCKTSAELLAKMKVLQKELENG